MYDQRSCRPLIAVLCIALVSCSFEGGMFASGEPKNDDDYGYRGGGEGESSVPEDSVVTSQSAGTLPGRLDVSPDGRPQYGIPLRVPAGRRGLQPDIGIRFGRNGRNGELGVGWGLTGMSSVMPCHRTHAQDGAPDAVAFDGTGPYCLDGTRLVAVEGANGADQSIYRLERDRNIKIVSHGVASGVAGPVPDRFVAHHPDGTKYVYGRRIVASQLQHTSPIGASPTATDVVYAWLLDRVSDSSGNSMDFVYRTVAPASSGSLSFDDRFALEYYPQRILYTSHESGLAPQRSIEFIYEPRADVIDRYTSGVHRRYRERLVRIEMHAPNPTTTERVWSYELSYTYSPDTNRSLLETITMCDIAGVCLPPTSFNWSGGFDGYETHHIGLSAGSDIHQAPHFRLADFDGDGKSDILYWDGDRDYCECVGSTCEQVTWGGTTSGEPCPELEAFRVSGEWRIAHLDESGVRYIHDTKLEAGWQTPGRQNGIPDSTGAVAFSALSTPDEYNPPTALDFDGDGASDLLSSRTGEIRAPSDGNTLLFTVGSTYETLPPFWEPDVRYLGDFDGDGRVDLFTNTNRPIPHRDTTPEGEFVTGWHGPTVAGDFTWAYRLGSGAAGGFAVEQSSPIAPFSVRHDNNILYRLFDPRMHTIARDTDGDGRVELMIPQIGNRYDTFEVDGSGAPIVSTTNATYNWEPVADLEEPQWYKPVYLDINGDGLDDVIASDGARQTSSGWMVLPARINTGNGFGPWYLAASLNYEPAAEQRHGQQVEAEYGPPSDDGIRVFDHNRDGRDDFLVPTASGPVVYVSNGRTFYPIPFSGGLAPPITVSAPGVPMHGPPPYWYLGQAHRFGDVNGDGLADLVQFDASLGTFGEFTVHLRKETTPDRLTAVENGLGRSESVVYATLADRSVYQPGTAMYPQQPLVGGGEVVSVMFRDIPGSQENILFRYEDARADRTGRGIVGFAKHTRIDSRRSREIELTFDVTTREHGTYPFRGRPIQVVVEDEIGALEKRVTVSEHTYQSHWAFGDRVVRITQPASDQHSHDVPLSTTSFPPTSAEHREEITRTFDTYGYLLSEESQRSGQRGGVLEMGAHTLTGFAVENRELPWQLGLRKSATITSTVGGAAETETTNFEYDGAGRLSRTVREPGSPSLELTTTFGIGAFGEVETVRSESSAAHPLAPSEVRDIQVAYDAEFLYPVHVLNPLGQGTELAVHPAHGELVRTLDPNGLEARRWIDGFGRLRRNADGTGAEVTIDYSDGGTHGAYAEQYASNQGFDETTFYERAGGWIERSRTAFDGTTTAVLQGFNSRGLPDHTTTPHFPLGDRHLQRFKYDGLGRIIQVTAPDSGTTGFSYTAHSTTRFDPMGRRTIERFDVNGWSVQSVAVDTDGAVPVERITTSTFGPFGRVASILDPNGGVRTLTYNARGDRLVLDDPSAGVRQWGYNAFGEIVEESDPISAAALSPTRIVRDRLGRVLEEHTVDGIATFLYDAGWVGALDTSTSTDGIEVNWQYDSRGRVHSKTTTVDGEPFEIELAYDSAARLDRVVYPDTEAHPRFSTTLSYALNGQLGAIHDDSGKLLWRANSRDARGQPTAEEFGGLNTIREYSPETGRLTRIRGYVSATGAHSFGLDLAYDLAGDLTSKSELLSGRYDSFEYDSLGRLDTWRRRSSAGAPDAVTTYQYDGVGNLLERRTTGAGLNIFETLARGGVAPQNGLDRYQRWEHGVIADDRAMTYDANGRRTGGPWSHVDYNAANKPLAISSTTGTTTYRYDADDRLVLEEGEEGQSVRVGSLFERRIDESGTRFIYTVHADVGPVAQVVDSDDGRKARYLHRDHLGTPLGVTDDSGAMIERRWFTPFGAPSDAAGHPVFASFASDTIPDFTGHRSNNELGLIDMGGRFYDPIGSTFLTPDPLAADFGNPAGLNRYAYVLNNPLRFVDPSGFHGVPAEEVDEAGWPESEVEQRNPDGSASSVDMTGGSGGSSPGQGTADDTEPAGGDDTLDPPARPDPGQDINEPSEQQTRYFDFRIRVSADPEYSWMFDPWRWFYDGVSEMSLGHELVAEPVFEVAVTGDRITGIRPMRNSANNSLNLSVRVDYSELPPEGARDVQLTVSVGSDFTESYSREQRRDSGRVTVGTTQNGHSVSAQGPSSSSSRREGRTTRVQHTVEMALSLTVAPGTSSIRVRRVRSPSSSRLSYSRGSMRGRARIIFAPLEIGRER